MTDTMTNEQIKDLPGWVMNKHNALLQRYEDAIGTIGFLSIEIADYQNYMVEKKLDDDFRKWYHEREILESRAT